jgi:hypothetical protein
MSVVNIAVWLGSWCWRCCYCLATEGTEASEQMFVSAADGHHMGLRGLLCSRHHAVIAGGRMRSPVGPPT